MTQRVLLLLFALGLFTAFAACSESHSTQEAPTTEIVQDWAPAAEEGNEVDVRLNEYRFELDRDTFVVGVPYTFHLVNEGAVAHEWAVVPHGDMTEDRMLIEVEDDDLPEGGSYDVTFTFPETGAYDFVCFMQEPVPHDAAGMRIPVIVVAAEQNS